MVLWLLGHSMVQMMLPGNQKRIFQHGVVHLWLGNSDW